MRQFVLALAAARSLPYSLRSRWLRDMSRYMTQNGRGTPAPSVREFTGVSARRYEPHAARSLRSRWILVIAGTRIVCDHYVMLNGLRHWRSSTPRTPPFVELGLWKRPNPAAPADSLATIDSDSGYAV